MNQMQVKYPTFLARLQHFAAGVLALPRGEFNVQLYDDYRALDTVQWAQILYDISVDELAAIFDRSEAPTWSQLKTLPSVPPASDKALGTYLGLVEPIIPNPAGGLHVYSGTGSALSRGVSGRSAQHGSPEYREAER